MNLSSKYHVFHSSDRWLVWSYKIFSSQTEKAEICLRTDIEAPTMAEVIAEQPALHIEETRPLLLRSLSDPTSSASTSQLEWRNFTVMERVPASMASCTDLPASVDMVQDVGNLESLASADGYTTGYSDAPTVCIRDEGNASGDVSPNQQSQDCQTSCSDLAQHCPVPPSQ